jgi:sulfur carrier protein
MNIQLNGAPQTLADGTTLAALIASSAGTTRGSAVIVDDVVVPRSHWDTTALRDGQRVELLTAVQGG